jgi:hypothetical protein
MTITHLTLTWTKVYTKLYFEQKCKGFKLKHKKKMKKKYKGKFLLTVPAKKRPYLLASL